MMRGVWLIYGTTEADSAGITIRWNSTFEHNGDIIVQSTIEFVGDKPDGAFVQVIATDRKRGLEHFNKLCEVFTYDVQRELLTWR